ncbi:cation:dicarboxylate symporter family transporter [Hoeflea poritis]|uniref:Cation:dicarboxylase symporter family transporter n=1 Tax=Hoeflea poritis TaxID=2993659 RepID=A0ABT4VII3_9HYPH|nr:cation:dicarboxylase symporter family transporter [Hoeflea poritis]MDA4844496.1 cation:dicarboxylase symporter family transporter [Hoeflea poritis]
MQSKRLPLYVLFGGAAGILIGLFSPLLAAIVAPVGDIYVRLMEVVVLPYLISSLILGLGQLAPETARKLFRKSWAIYLALWAMTFTVLLFASLTVPLVRQAAVVDFSGALSALTSQGASLIDLLVPDNLFQALSNNYIPSIVLMGLIFGIAVQRSNKPTELLDMLSVVRQACIRIWEWVVLLAPIGVCALFASSISSMDPEGYAAMSIYIVVVMLSALLLSLWILPMMLTAFLPMKYWELMSELKEAFLIAVVTSLSVASLPMIQRATQNMAEKYCEAEKETEQREIIQTTLSVSYPLAQIGNFFILAFLLYASFYFFIPLTGWQLIELPVVTLLSGFGSPTSSIGAVAFMANWLNMPSETTNLYVETMAITRYAQVLASVAGFAFVTILVTFAFYGRLRFDIRRFVVTIAVAAICMTAILSLGRLGGTHIQLHSETNYLEMGLPAEVQALSDENLVSRLSKGDAQETGSAPEAAKRGEAVNVLGRIQSNGVLRVGINPNVMPFTYENNKGRLVGYDVELMYRFAQSMSVEIVFVPYDWQSLIKNLTEYEFDIAIGGIYITKDRLEAVTVSDPYYENPLALIVRTDQINDFASRGKINAIENLTIAVFDDPVLIPAARRSFPSANIRVLPNYDNLENEEGVDAAIWTLEQARAWAISHGGYSTAVPRDIATRFLFAYLMPPDAPGLSDYLNYWMRLQKDNGVLADMTKRWIDPAATDSER